MPSAKTVASRLKQRHMKRDQLLPVAAIAATGHSGDRQPMLDCTVKYHGIAQANPFVAQGEIAKLVSMMHIDARLIEDEIR